MRKKYYARLNKKGEAGIVNLLIILVIIGVLLKFIALILVIACIYYCAKGLYEAVTIPHRRWHGIITASLTGGILLFTFYFNEGKPPSVPIMDESKAGDFKYVGQSLEKDGAIISLWRVTLRFADNVYELETEKPTDTHTWGKLDSRVRFTIDENGKIKNYIVSEKFCSANLVNCHFEDPNVIGFDSKKWVDELIANILFDKYSDLKLAEIVYKLQSRREATIIEAIKNDSKRINELRKN